MYIIFQSDKNKIWYLYNFRRFDKKISYLFLLWQILIFDWYAFELEVTKLNRANKKFAAKKLNLKLSMKEETVANVVDIFDFFCLEFCFQQIDQNSRQKI